MIDLVNYPQKKIGGFVALAKIGNAYAISEKRFHEGTGKELDPEIAALAMADIDKNIADFQAKIDALTLLKADLEALG
jgi:hypothetical protein